MSNANLNDSATAIGWVHIIKHDSDGKKIYDKWHKNQLTNFARNASARLWAGNVIPTPSYMQIGTGSPTAPRTGVDPTDTALWEPMGGTLKACDFTTVWLTYNTQYSVTYQQTEANGDWTEIGLLDSENNLWSHIGVSGFTKNSGETVTLQWQITHVGN